MNMDVDREALLSFVLKARTKMYAAAGGKVESVFPGMDQLEYREGEFLDRDLYNNGKGVFMGLETVYLKERPIWSVSYYGDYRGMTEREVDRILRNALIENQETTRLWRSVRWEHDGYAYTCTPDFEGSIENMAGLEEITKEGTRIYHFLYAGGLLV
ncbi:MAG: DUF5680 domain-containing protein [Candidatus Pacearchaeota archaeon]|nr:DUF5680 domain-containing protein [Candidatus Pacearchaeota archaeon]